MYTLIKGPFSEAYNRQQTTPNRSGGFKNPLRGFAYAGGLIIHAVLNLVNI